MIEQIYIKNFKAFERMSIPLDKHNILIGENDAGKSTVLQALDIFFNQEKVDKSFVRDITQPVEIGILVNKKFYKKIYTPSSYKLNSYSDNIFDIDNLRYIYIPVSAYDPKQLITQLAIAKTLSNTREELLNELKTTLQNSINEVIDGVDNELIIVNNENTTIVGEQALKYDAAIKFNVSSNGIPIEARGSGFQKNLMYALLVGNNYDNVIVGIDEIENSFSVNNCQNMISELQNKIGQTILTTHSKKIMEVRNMANIIPLYTNNYKTLSELLSCLDNTEEKKYLLVEGKYDLPWFKKAINLLGKDSDYILLPAGGESNADNLKVELENLGKNCLIIKDGDTNDDNCLQKDCIELYAPLDSINNILGITLDKIPQTKEEFFQETTIDGVRNEDSVKRILATRVAEFLDMDNDFINEVKNLLGI